ncbi:hypothetical protein F5X68DRAFT_66237 [Plectosphaerella plurivora]|uniref:Rho-GAP domain-containing protein n=1 Tax=Plectosphaerella plurivora TaxID=936078 RepID=A0A9P9AFE7_9PEZI|nr:hypothetical protein F5X68DRAFT_66237 [Plectosphaerella plurivora]
MGRKAVPQPLTLSEPSSTLSEGTSPSAETLHVVSPPSVDSRSSPRTPRSPFSRFSPKKPQSQQQQQQQKEEQQINSTSTTQAPLSTAASSHSRALDDWDDEEDEDSQRYPPITSALYQPSETTPTRPKAKPSPRAPDRAQTGDSRPAAANSTHRDDSKIKSGFFSHFSKSSSRAPSAHHHHHSHSIAEGMSRGAAAPTMTSKLVKNPDTSYANPPSQKTYPSIPSKSDLSLASNADPDNAATSANTLSKKSKPKPFGLLHRTRSNRDQDSPSPKDQLQAIPSPAKAVEHERATTPNSTHNNSHTGVKTAPVGSDRAHRDKMSSTSSRNRSMDRDAPPLPARDQSNREFAPTKDHHPNKLQSMAGHRAEGAGFFGGLRNSRAADMISKGLFGKSMRSGSTTEREPIIDDEHYSLKVINLPLVEQTRLTRISKRLEDSRDKTEFWMPAFPWRAIDYLNYKGCDVEGLYRVPGSGPQIKKWQRRFDEEYDVNLFEQNDLYDINIVGSMLKAWLRELPDELFPKDAQERVARECAGAEKVPQMLIDELSNLSPFNYYLLFAITCHLSLLLAHSDKNKMDFRNLCICFQPCMKIDAFCFRFLVCEWRDCWKGCKQEAKFIEQEYSLFDQPPPRGLADGRKPSQNDETPAPSSVGATGGSGSVAEERGVSSSDSSKKSTASIVNSSTGNTNNTTSEKLAKGQRKKKPVQLSESNGSVGSDTTASTTLTINSDLAETPRRSGDLRPLSPIKPLSPLGF